jgi:outer membrane receptor protein involved in Fe transport
MNLGLTSGRYELALYARNLLDKRAYNYALPETNNGTGQTFLSCALVQPRTVGLSVDVKF